MTDGAGQIGTRSGEQVDLRYFVDANGIYDTGLQPLATNSQGKLTQVGGLAGVELLLGAYGSHTWRRSLLSLDYSGDFIDYPHDSYYDVTNQSLTLGYTYQKSRRVYFDFRMIGGTYSYNYGSVAGENAPSDAINQSSLLLFDNRTAFAQGFVGMTYMLSARTSLTVGGDGFYVDRQSGQLIGVDGYDARARLQYRLSRRTSLGGEYQRSHYQFPKAFGNSDINNYSIYLASQLGRDWTFSLDGGAYQVSTVGVQQVALSPNVAAILGISYSDQAFAVNNWLPAGRATLTRKFRHANLSFGYSRTMIPGNGVYLTSREESGTANYSYMGLRKVNFTIGGNYGDLSSVGFNISPYKYYLASVSLTYNLSKALHLVARYDLRHQEITYVSGFPPTSYRVTLGLAFSPGTLPLSLW